MKKAFTRLLLFISLFTGIASFSPPTPETHVLIKTRFGNIIVKLYNETPIHRENFIKLVKQGYYDSLLFHRVIPNFMIQGGDPLSKNAKQGTVLGNGDPGYTLPAEFTSRGYHKRGALGAARNDNPTKASNGSQFYIVSGRKFVLDELNRIMNQTNFNTKQELFQKIIKSDTIAAQMGSYVARGDNDGLQAYFNSLQPLVESEFRKVQLRYSPEQARTYSTKGGAPHLDGYYTVFGEVVSGIEFVDSIALQPRDSNDRPLQDLRIRMSLLKD
ncbi:MAG: peptidylprolyl isomerase [Bacteroidia bacterium]|jgi:peptidyl-prolyl cis-trans isomerase B (cyclophilin B)|nr:peptidylprolyl isomerase [Bacteroidia bacterium]